MKRFLVTTALEESWPAEGPVLFLGEWCRLHARRERWLPLDAEVLPYHWDDRGKLHADYRYLLEFHERLLADVAEQLNGIHGVDHSLRYWRILVGPWLGYFVQMLFDRWSCIQRAVSQVELIGTIVLTGDEETLVPNDMEDFVRLFLYDQWNHHLCAAILQNHTEVPCIRQARAGAARGSCSEPTPSWHRQSKRMLAAWYAHLAGLFARDGDAFLLGTYLPALDEVRLHRRLGQVPILWRSVPPVQVPVDRNRRRWALPGGNRSEFEACARAFIPKQIPAVYLEGYGQLRAQTARLPWPKQPKLIWTANSDNADDVFKAWTAEKVELGSPFVIGQHGGHYGVGLWSFTEHHQLAISDCYLSWGWTEPGTTVIAPVGQLKAKLPLGVRHAQQPHALLVTAVHPRFSYVMYSTPVAGQWVDYFADQFDFVAHLPRAIQDSLIVRVYRQDLDWDQLARWRERFPALRLDDGQSNIDDLISKSRLYISTYNATTYLESLTMDVPTVIYWDPRRWELRPSARPFFADLRRVGVFHDTPASAARHVSSVWLDVDAWWTSPAVREVVARFKARYCHLPDDLLDGVERALRGVMKGPAPASMR